MAIDSIQALEAEIERLNQSIQTRIVEYKEDKLSDEQHTELVKDGGILMIHKVDLELLLAERNRRIPAAAEQIGAKQGISRTGITCFININGFRTITADETESTYSSNIKLVPYTRSLTEDKMNSMIKRVEKFASQDKRLKNRPMLKISLNRKYIYLLKNLLNNEKNISNDNKKIIESVVEKQIQRLAANQDAEVVELMAHKQQIEVIVTPFNIQLYEEGDSDLSCIN
ncbi:unnamed protein product [Adineta steineri]|uniref:Uncharacterized protein n=1 Tax=Adineta steineri TaxID=433720 RepID=A0A815NBH1_9BILA|nr:unnamed protein product [Adineta steineri]CAF1622972.1 unnamed protein product [Adineta steineri]